MLPRFASILFLRTRRPFLGLFTLDLDVRCQQENLKSPSTQKIAVCSNCARNSFSSAIDGRPASGLSRKKR